MAVLIQPLIAARSAGVAFSRHPVTGASNVVVINAVAGLADALVSGAVTPDSYLVEIPAPPGAPKVVERAVNTPSFVRLATERGLVDQPVTSSSGQTPSLSDTEAVELARLVKQVESQMDAAVDVEWAHDGTRFWFLQARPMTPQERVPPLTDATSTWSRANFKETMPDLPTPLGLAFLEGFMEDGILRHYRQLGCHIPPGTSSVRIVAGRPYINVSLFQSFMAQLWGDPRQVIEQMGGEGAPLPYGAPPLPWWKVLRAGLMMEWKIHRAALRAASWFLAMKEMARSSEAQMASPLSPSAIVQELHAIDHCLRERDLTFAIVGGVSQAFFVLGRLLQRRLGTDWRPLLNASLQGSGTVISANQIDRLSSLAETAGREPTASAFLLAESWVPQSFRTALAGTTFLSEFDAYLRDYGHRAMSESDVGSPRFAEIPEYVLGVIRAQLQRPSSPSAGPRGQETAATRRAALKEICRRFGWRRHEWLFFRWWHRRLDRFLALREANRHHLMYFSLAVRRLELQLADHFVASGRLRNRKEIFFLRPDEIQALAKGAALNAIELVERRMEERARREKTLAPDVIRGLGELTLTPAERASSGREGRDDHVLRGLPISTGVAEGPVRLIRDPMDAAHVQRGDIIVTTAIDPGLAPVFSLAAGLVAEMGGVLSHGAIIAREYGLPTVANVTGATRLLHEEERIIVDGGRGAVRRVE
jgi:pyruvate,water dikinase